MYNTDKNPVVEWPDTWTYIRGKEWGKGYEKIGVERSQLWNMGTENGLIPFDIRRMFDNLVGDYGSAYSPDRPLLQRQKETRDRLRRWRHIKRWSRDERG